MATVPPLEVALHLERAMVDTFPAMLARLATRFTPGTIVDVGASDGRWSRMALEVWPAARLLLFEANPVYDHALAQMEREGAQVARALACACASGETTLRMDAEKPYQGVYDLADPMHESVGTPVTAALATIDHEVESRAMPGPYLIKLDTHGREHEILAGARETLKQAGGIIAEVYTWSQGPNSMRAAELIPHIEREHGFLPSDLAEPLRRPMDGRLVQIDLLMEPASAEFMQIPNMW